MQDGTYQRRMIGWSPTCDHEADIVPCVVLDPFLGSGTTLLVARDLGRSGIGIDLSKDYLKLAKKRLSLPRTQDEHDWLAQESRKRRKEARPLTEWS